MKDTKPNRKKKELFAKYGQARIRLVVRTLLAHGMSDMCFNDIPPTPALSGIELNKMEHLRMELLELDEEDLRAVIRRFI